MARAQKYGSAADGLERMARRGGPRHRRRAGGPRGEGGRRQRRPHLPEVLRERRAGGGPSFATATATATAAASNKDKIARIARAQKDGLLPSRYPAAELLALVLHIAAFWTAITPDFEALAGRTSRTHRRQVVIDTVTALLRDRPPRHRFQVSPDRQPNAASEHPDRAGHFREKRVPPCPQRYDPDMDGMSLSAVRTWRGCPRNSVI